MRRLFYLLSFFSLLSACNVDEVSENNSLSEDTQSKNISSITPQGFSVEAKDYSINLSYSANNAAESVNIYKGYCEGTKLD